MARTAVPRQSRLQVFLDRGAGSTAMLVGECIWLPSKQTAAFEWSREARACGLQLSPLMMPVSEGVQIAGHDPFQGIHPLFSDSIPDGFGLRLMNKGLELAGHDLDTVNPLHRLAWVGERGAGALTFKPAIDARSDPVLNSIADLAAIAARAQTLSFRDIPKEAIRAGGSALGARPKFWAALGPDKTRIVLGDQPNVPEGFTPSLLKFAPSGGDKNEPFFEAACLDLAGRYGVKAARGQLLTHPGGAALAVERFDRLPTGERVHTQSVAALLGLNFRAPSLTYAALAKLATKIGGTADLERLYRQICFNVALSMRDDHAKNFAFCMDAAGQWSLSPAFDLCPAKGFGFTQEHTTTLNGKGTLISRSDLEVFARSQGLSRKTAQEGIDNARAAATEFEGLAISLGSTKTGAKAWSKAFKAIDKHLQTTLVSASASRA